MMPPPTNKPDAKKSSPATVFGCPVGLSGCVASDLTFWFVTVTLPDLLASPQSLSSSFSAARAASVAAWEATYCGRGVENISGL